MYVLHLWTNRIDRCVKEYPALLHSYLVHDLAVAAIGRDQLQDSLVLQIALDRSVENDSFVIHVCREVRSAQNGIIVESGLKIALDTLISGRLILKLRL